MAKKIDAWKWNEERSILSAIIAESKAQVDFDFKKISYFKVPVGELLFEPWLNGWKVKLTGAIGGKMVRVEDMPKLMTDLFNSIVDADQWAQRKAAAEKVVVSDAVAIARKQMEEGTITEKEYELMLSLLGQARAAGSK